MNVTFSSDTTLGNKKYKAGIQMIADHLARNQQFKRLVQSGSIVIHPKDANAQKTQASKDAQNAAKAQAARQLTKDLNLSRASNELPAATAGIVLAQKAQRAQKLKAELRAKKAQTVK